MAASRHTAATADVALLSAAKRGAVQLVREAVRNASSIDVRDARSGSSALQLAAGGGHLVAVQVLLMHGADVNAQNNAGDTALTLASAAGHADVVDVLLAAPTVDVELANARGLSVLHVAASRGHLRILESVFLFIARLPLPPGRPSPALALAAKPSAVGMTALHCAAGHGHAALARAILRIAPAIVDLQDSSRYTALHHAAKNGHRDAVAALVQAGADTRLRTAQGMTAESMTSSADVRATLHAGPAAGAPASAAAAATAAASAADGLHTRPARDLETDATVATHGVNHWWAATGTSPDAYDAHPATASASGDTTRAARDGLLGVHSSRARSVDPAAHELLARKLAGRTTAGAGAMRPMSTRERAAYGHYRDYSIRY